MTGSENDPDAELRSRLADAVAQEAAFEGFSRAGLAAAAAKLGLPTGEGERLFPGGGLAVVEYLSERADRRTVEDMEKAEVAGMKVRERIKTAVRMRLERHVGSRESVRRALALLALPLNAPIGLKLLYKTVDAMWYAAGDTSTDFNFYTKRAILSGVYSSTLLYWLNDRSEGHEATWAFLDRRIEDVMQFEKLKAKVKSWTRPETRAASRK
jgi:ubiquinone biosynthesis protein COQ9